MIDVLPHLIIVVIALALLIDWLPLFAAAISGLMNKGDE